MSIYVSIPLLPPFPFLSCPFILLTHRKIYFDFKLSLLHFISIGLLLTFVKRAVSQALSDDTFFGNDVLDSDLFLDESSPSLTSQLSSNGLSGGGGGDATEDFFVADALPADDLLAHIISFNDNLLTDNDNVNLLVAKGQSCAGAKSSRKLKSRQMDTSSSTSCPDPQAGTGAGTVLALAPSTSVSQKKMKAYGRQSKWKITGVPIKSGRELSLFVARTRIRQCSSVIGGWSAREVRIFGLFFPFAFCFLRSRLTTSSTNQRLNTQTKEFLTSFLSINERILILTQRISDPARLSRMPTVPSLLLRRLDA